MNKIQGIEGMSLYDLNLEVQQGGKFVMFPYCISVVVITFRRWSGVYFVKKGQSAVGKGIGFTLISLLLGWWGIPWGPIFTIQSIVRNFAGGKDVTIEVISSLRQKMA